MTTIEDVMYYAREAGNMERRMCIGKAQGFDVRNAYNDLRAAIEQYAAAAVLAEREDADRYRLLRRGQHWSVIDGVGDVLRAERLDAAIDAIRTEPKKEKQP